METSEIVARMVEKWPSALVARADVGKFSGGVLHPRSLANHDSLGTGPKQRLNVGRKVCYPALALAEWLASRAEIRAGKGGDQ